MDDVKLVESKPSQESSSTSLDDDPIRAKEMVVSNAEIPANSIITGEFESELPQESLPNGIDKSDDRILNKEASESSIVENVADGSTMKHDQLIRTENSSPICIDRTNEMGANHERVVIEEPKTLSEEEDMYVVDSSINKDLTVRSIDESDDRILNTKTSESSIYNVADGSTFGMDEMIPTENFPPIRIHKIDESGIKESKILSEDDDMDVVEKCKDGSSITLDESDHRILNKETSESSIIDGSTLGRDELIPTENYPPISIHKIDEMEANHGKSKDCSSIDNDLSVSSISNSNSGELRNDNHSVPSDEFSRLKVKFLQVCPENVKQGDLNRGLIDTAAPFESVKEAVSMFGGIVDWKAHRIHTAERLRLVDQELEQAQEEIPEYRKRSEEAEEEKLMALKELDRTKRLIEELKLNLEKAQTEEHQAKQDSELAKLRVEEIEQGIADESSVAAKAQLEVAKARHVAAVSDLKYVQEELDALSKEYACLVSDKDIALEKAEEATDKCKEVEKIVEELAIELIATKEALESAHTTHLEAEERRIGAAMTREQDSVIWEKELKQADEELRRITKQILSGNELKFKLDTASTLLLDLKAELAAYMQSILKEETDIETQLGIGQSAIVTAKKELEEVKLDIEKATEKIRYLKVAAVSLKSELEDERSGLSCVTQREAIGSGAIGSIETEVEETRSEIAQAQKKVEKAKEEPVGLPRQLQQAVKELRKAEEEADQAKAGVNTIMSRLFAVRKEIEAAEASEISALTAIKALQETELGRNSNDIDSSIGVTLSLEEYYELRKRARNAEERAISRVAAATSQIELAKEFETKSLEKLEEVNREMAARKEELKIAMDNAEKAQEGKLGVEQELRKWRGENEQRRKSSECSHGEVSCVRIQRTSLEGQKESSDEAIDTVGSTPTVPIGTEYDHIGSFLDTKTGKKKKRSFFPRVLMFLARRKAHPNKPT